MSGTKVQVDDFEIYYEKHGNGHHKLLLLPGILGKKNISLITLQLNFEFI